MKDRIIHYTKEVLLFFIVLTLFANLISYYKSFDLNKAPLLNVQATLLDGSSFTTTSIKKPLLIHFWAVWCPTCKLEADNIERISKLYNVVTIVVKSGSDKDIQSYLQEHNFNFKVINDENGFLVQRFNISAYPTTFIYDKNANLAFSEVGYTSSLGLILRMWWAGL